MQVVRVAKLPIKEDGFCLGFLFWISISIAFHDGYENGSTESSHTLPSHSLCVRFKPNTKNRMVFAFSNSSWILEKFNLWTELLVLCYLCVCMYISKIFYTIQVTRFFNFFLFSVSFCSFWLQRYTFFCLNCLTKGKSILSDTQIALFPITYRSVHWLLFWFWVPQCEMHGDFISYSYFYYCIINTSLCSTVCRHILAFILQKSHWTAHHFPK